MKYKVVISYPSDVAPERAIAREVCALITRARRADNVELVPFDWEREINHLITGDPTQKIIDADISDSDIFICILWHQFGDPQKVLQNMTPTESEFEDAFARQQRTGRPVNGARIDIENLGNNTFKATTLHVDSYSLWLHPKMVDFSLPIKVTTNGVITEHRCNLSLLTALKSFERRNDWGLIYPARILVNVAK